jgi:hypothetical protein
VLRKPDANSREDPRSIMISIRTRFVGDASARHVRFRTLRDVRTITCRAEVHPRSTPKPKEPAIMMTNVRIGRTACRRASLPTRPVRRDELENVSCKGDLASFASHLGGMIAVTALTVALLCQPGPAMAATEVYVLAGQSNMVGWGVASELTPPYSESQSAVKFWRDDGWVNLQAGFAEDAQHFGPEVSFGARLHATSPSSDIYLVKCATGGTSLAVDWNADGSGAQYNSLKAAVAAAMNQLRGEGRSPVIAGMAWMQGEQDAGNTTMASAYAANLTTFITSVRSDLGAPNMPFVLGRIITAYGSAENNALVRTAQETVLGQVGAATWINTDDLQVGSYANHYGTQGQIDLGIRFADQMIHAPEPSALALAGSGMFVVAGCWWRKRYASAGFDAVGLGLRRAARFTRRGECK